MWRLAQGITLCVSLLVALVGCGGAGGVGAESTPTGPREAPVACPGCWRPALTTSWQWQLSGTIDQSVAVQMYDLDLFETLASVVASLHSSGRKVVCYLNAGAWENWRPDAGNYPRALLGKGLQGW